MSYLRKAPSAADAEAQLQDLQADRFWEGYPAIWEYLACGRYPDGSARQRASLTVFVEDGLIKLCLSDRDCERTAWGGSDEMLDALAGLDRALQEGHVQWRRKPPTANPPRPKKG